MKYETNHKKKQSIIRKIVNNGFTTDNIFKYLVSNSDNNIGFHSCISQFKSHTSNLPCKQGQGLKETKSHVSDIVLKLINLL